MAKVSKRKEKILATLIPNLVKTAESIVCMEQIDAFEKLCAPIAPTMAAIENRLADLRKPRHTCSTPHNKKITPQRNHTFHSTKKKKRGDSNSKRLVKPTMGEKQEITMNAILNLTGQE